MFHADIVMNKVPHARKYVPQQLIAVARALYLSCFIINQCTPIASTVCLKDTFTMPVMSEKTIQ